MSYRPKSAHARTDQPPAHLLEKWGLDASDDTSAAAATAAAAAGGGGDPPRADEAAPPAPSPAPQPSAGDPPAASRPTRAQSAHRPGSRRASAADGDGPADAEGAAARLQVLIMQVEIPEQSMQRKVTVPTEATVGEAVAKIAARNRLAAEAALYGLYNAQRREWLDTDARLRSYFPPDTMMSPETFVLQQLPPPVTVEFPDGRTAPVRMLRASMPAGLLLERALDGLRRAGTLGDGVESLPTGWEWLALFDPQRANWFEADSPLAHGDSGTLLAKVKPRALRIELHEDPTVVCELRYCTATTVGHLIAEVCSRIDLAKGEARGLYVCDDKSSGGGDEKNGDGDSRGAGDGRGDSAGGEWMSAERRVLTYNCDNKRVTLRRYDDRRIHSAVSSWAGTSDEHTIGSGTSTPSQGSPMVGRHNNNAGDSPPGGTGGNSGDGGGDGGGGGVSPRQGAGGGGSAGGAAGSGAVGRGPGTPMIGMRSSSIAIAAGGNSAGAGGNWSSKSSPSGARRGGPGSSFLAGGRPVDAPSSGDDSAASVDGAAAGSSGTGGADERRNDGGSGSPTGGASAAATNGAAGDGGGLVIGSRASPVTSPRGPGLTASAKAASTTEVRADAVRHAARKQLSSSASATATSSTPGGAASSTGGAAGDRTSGGDGAAARSMGSSPASPGGIRRRLGSPRGGLGESTIHLLNKVSSIDLPDTEEHVLAKPTATGEREILAASLEKVVQLLTTEKGSDAKFMHTFILTFQTFTTPEHLLELLEERYDIRKRAPDPESSDFVATVERPVQLRVVQVIKTWMELNFVDFDEELVIKTSNFIERMRSDGNGHLAKKLSTTLNRLLSDERKSTELMFDKEPPAPKLPRNFGSMMMSFWDVDEEELARQLTLIDFEVFHSIRPYELLGQAWNKERLQHRCPNVMHLIERFNTLSRWVTTVIVKAERIKDRVKVMTKVVKIMVGLRNLNNYMSLMAFIAGINHFSVLRLKWTRKEMSKNKVQLMESLESLMSSENNYRSYRDALRATNPPLIPYIGLMLQDLTFTDEGNPDYVRRNGAGNGLEDGAVDNDDTADDGDDDASSGSDGEHQGDGSAAGGGAGNDDGNNDDGVDVVADPDDDDDADKNDHASAAAAEASDAISQAVEAKKARQQSRKDRKKRPAKVQGLLNLEKCQLVAEAILQLQQYQQKHYNLMKVPKIASMLARLPTKTDDELSRMSLSREPRGSVRQQIS